MKVTAVILAGGLGRRMGNTDKGLKLLRGKPMVCWVWERLTPQVDEVLINANRNLEEYSKLGCKVVPDSVAAFAGPLAGLERGLALAAHPLVATAPCDSPFLPLDLIARLRGALEKNHAELAVARTFDQPHPVFCLARRELHGHLLAFLRQGGRKIDAWYASLKVVEVAFDDEAAAFGNINTEEELASLETKAG